MKSYLSATGLAVVLFASHATAGESQLWQRSTLCGGYSYMQGDAAGPLSKGGDNTLVGKNQIYDFTNNHWASENQETHQHETGSLDIHHCTSNTIDLTVTVLNGGPATATQCNFKSFHTGVGARPVSGTCTTGNGLERTFTGQLRHGVAPQ